jgi:hypothetical protein
VTLGARTAVALVVCLITLAALAGPALGQPSAWLALAPVVTLFDVRPDTDGIPARHAILNSFDALGDETPMPAPAGPDLPIVTTTVADREPTDLRLLMTDGERWRLMEIGTALTWRPLPASVKAFGQIPYTVTDRAAETSFLDAKHEPAVLSITGRLGDFEAGAQYRSVGKRLERLIGPPPALKDREGHEIWVAQRFGAVRFRLASSELTDNVDRNPALPRTTKDEGAVTTELALSGWPVLGLTFASGDATRVRLTPEGRDRPPERHEFESLTASAYYHGGPRWNLTASTTFWRSRHVGRVDDDMAMLSQDLGLTLKPLEAFTVTPTLHLARERYASSGLGIESGTAGLTLTYAPRASRWSASSFVGYSATRARDASTDGRSLNVTGAITCGLGRWLPGASVSFEAGYDQYVDVAVPESASRAVSAFVFIRLARF